MALHRLMVNLVYVNVPGWTNPNTGAAEFISGATPIAASLGTIQKQFIN